MMVDEFLAKWKESVGRQELDLLLLMKNHKFDDLASFNSIQGRIQGINLALETMRELYDNAYVPKESITVTKEGIKPDVKPSLY